MLEELMGAGLGWDHPFVQCKLEYTLRAMKDDQPAPPNGCAHLTPRPSLDGDDYLQSSLAFVRFAPPNDAYADEVYYPPAAKKGFDDR